MKKKQLNLRMQTLFIMNLLLLITSCATFYNSEGIKSVQTKSVTSKRIGLSILLEQTNYRDKSVIDDVGRAYISGEDSAFNRPRLETTVNDVIKVFKKSGNIERIRVLSQQMHPRGMDLNLTLTYVSGGQYDNFHYYWQWLTALSIGIIPFWQKKELGLRVSVYDKNWKKIKDYEFYEKALDVKHLLLLPLAPFFRSDLRQEQMFDVITQKAVNLLIKNNHL